MKAGLSHVTWQVKRPTPLLDWERCCCFLATLPLPVHLCIALSCHYVVTHTCDSQAKPSQDAGCGKALLDNIIAFNGVFLCLSIINSLYFKHYISIHNRFLLLSTRVIIWQCMKTFLLMRFPCYMPTFRLQATTNTNTKQSATYTLLIRENIVIKRKKYLSLKNKIFIL